MSSTRIRRLWPAILCLFLFFAASNVLGAASPDQSFEPESFNSWYALFGNLEIAQTFTVGVTGELTMVDVLVTKPADIPLLFDVRRTVAGLPQRDNQDVLVSCSTIPAFEGSDWCRFDFADTPVAVSSGDVLAIVLRSPTAPSCLGYSWAGDCFGGYSGGKGVARDVGVSPYWARPGMEDLGDLGFRTFVVPEASSCLLLGVGALFLLARAICRKRVARDC